MVEDAMDHALLLVAFLRDAGELDISRAQDGDRAIELIDDQEFDLVITDLNLPGTDGFEVIRHARTTRPGLRLAWNRKTPSSRPPPLINTLLHQPAV